MHTRCPEHSRCRRLIPVGPAKAALLALLVVSVAFSPPLTPRAEATSNPGVTFSPGLLNVDEGSSSDYTVVLDSEPDADTTVAIYDYYLGGTNGVTYEPTSLDFTTDNWDEPQTITVTAAQDDDDTGISFGVSHSVTVDGTNSSTRASLTVKVNDDDKEEVKLSTTSLSLYEGESRDYTVWLSRKPESNVTVDPLAIGSIFAFEPSELTFTPDNWATPQTFTITAEYDEDWVNDTATIWHRGGADYGHNRTTRLAVTVYDILAPSVRVYPRTLNLNAGETASYKLSMWSTRCSEDTVVTVTIRSDNPSVRVNRGSVTFTRADWCAETQVTVTAASGAGDLTATLTHTVTGHSHVTTAPQLPVKVTGGGTTTTTITTPVVTPVTVPTTSTPSTGIGTNTNLVATGPGSGTETGADDTDDTNTDDTDTDDTDTDAESGDGDGDGGEDPGGVDRVDCAELDTQTPFVDVSPTSPTAQAIACIYALGITTGTTPTTYSPASNVTRAQMAIFLARLYKTITGTDAEIAETPFTDVAATDSASDDIGRIYGLGITTGTSATTYSPAANVTRAQMAIFLARLYKAATGTEAPVIATPFTDVDATSTAYNDIGRIYGLEITTGTTPTTYSPANNVTRAQMASFLARLYTAATTTNTPITTTQPD